jgi:hypothetical protein
MTLTHESRPDLTGTGVPADRIEITPEMAEAGLDVAWRSPLMEATEGDLRLMVSQIFVAMMRAKRTHHSET